MARITVNETGTQPLILVSTTVGNSAQIQSGNIANANVLSVSCLQDVTITSSTGVFSWTDFCSIDTNKLPTPADNEITTNIVLDDVKYFGANVLATGASNQGIAALSQNKVEVQFLVVWNNSNVSAVVDGGQSGNTYWSSGVGYITNLAPTVSPDAPVWVSPLSIAVDGTLYNGKD
jgi:hypothetical protein